MGKVGWSVVVTGVLFSMSVVDASPWRPRDPVFDYKTNGGFSTQCTRDGYEVGNWVDCRPDGTCANRKALITQCRTRHGNENYNLPRWDYVINAYKDSNTKCINYGVFVGQWHDCKQDGTCMDHQAILDTCRSRYRR